MYRSLVLILAVCLQACCPSLFHAQAPPPNSGQPADRVTLTVSITGLRGSKGNVLVQLWDGPEGFPTKGNDKYKLVAVPAATALHGTLTTTFEIAPGSYAVSIMHDENGNGKMDTNLIGIPKEGYGASNNVVTHLHAPSFDQARFQVPARGQAVSIAMHY